MKFTVNFLPAKYGDCIWIEYGEGEERYRILIDGGTGGTKHIIKNMIQELPEEERHFELIVVTHIDRDHIEGILSLLEEDKLGFTAGDFWFNGWNHLPGNSADEPFGAVQGERLTASILKHRLPWNSAFDGKAVAISAQGELPVISLPGEMKLTIISPLIQNLATLKGKWVAEVLKANLKPGFGLDEESAEGDIERFGLETAIPNIDALNDEEFHEDDAAANGSSIAFLAEYGGKRALFAGDSFPSVVLQSLNKLYDSRAPIDLMKLSHHASAHNTSPELIEKLECKRYAISTNGSIYKHPAQVTVARIIKRGGKRPELIFNYATPYTKIWKANLLPLKHKYETTYPNSEGIIVALL